LPKVLFEIQPQTSNIHDTVANLAIRHKIGQEWCILVTIIPTLML